MAYVVRIAARAERDLVSIFEKIDAVESPKAREWYAGLKKSILKLALRPSRCPLTPENRKLRHLLYGRKPHIYRVIYRVDERRNAVTVLHIRHGKRRRFGSTDLR